MLEFILLLVVAFPLAWLSSEFYNNRGARIVLGVCAIGTCYFVAYVMGSLEGMRANVYFSEATKDLIQNTIIELENGKSDLVLSELRTLRENFRPTYETRDNYDLLVDRYIHAISETPVEHEAGVREWSHEK